jgi:hypothetical protein
MRKWLVTACAVIALAACYSTDPEVNRQNQMAPLIQAYRNLQAKGIELYGYENYAECAGRGLSPTSNAMVYCLESQRMQHPERMPVRAEPTSEGTTSWLCAHRTAATDPSLDAECARLGLAR